MALLQVKSNADLEAEAQAKYAAEQQVAAPAELISSLAAHVEQCYREAEDHKSKVLGPLGSITDRLNKCQRQFMGIYESDKLAEIKASGGGSELFTNITATKSGALQSWLSDVVLPEADKPWMMEATPVSDLPEDVQSEVINGVVMDARSGMVPMDPMLVQQYALDLYEKTVQAVQGEAQNRIERMEKKIDDQLIEGGFRAVLTEIILDVSIFPLAILKGPVVEKQKRLKWVRGQISPTDEITPTWHRVSPFDWYPAPNALTENDAYVIETGTLDARQLASMRGVDGWNTEAINAALSDIEAEFSSMSITGESERAQSEGRDINVKDGVTAVSKRKKEFWGAVQGRLLQEWGLQVNDENEFYEVQVVKVGKHVVKAIKNPDPLNRRPYSLICFEPVPGSMPGLALPEKMRDCQDRTNACWRNLDNNLALCAGPMMAIDIDTYAADDDPTKVYPMRIWQYHGKDLMGSTREPVKFFQVDARASELLEVAERIEEKADDRTLIPRYAHGNDDVKGAGGTASGLSMLMKSAAKGVQRVLGGIDVGVRLGIDRLYAWNLLYDPDPMIKGDARIVSKGVLSALVRETTQMRRQEFLNNTNNPVDMAIIGYEGRAAVLKEVAKGLDIPVEQIIPDEDELRVKIEAMQMGAMGGGNETGKTDQKAAA